MVTTSSTVTRGIRVEVEAQYIPERSSPETQRWFFAYRVRLVNEGDVKVQLLSRHWIITDANGREEEVKGPGVVGAQPVLELAGEFEYTSFCPLGTPFGSMRGTYQMVTDKGEMFDATIAPFSLNEPLSIN